MCKKQITIQVLVITLALMGCASVHIETETESTTIRSFAQSKTTVCHVRHDRLVAQTCYNVETKGISGEFAVIMRAAFGWIPWPF